jgi:hypothetical protein
MAVINGTAIYAAESTTAGEKITTASHGNTYSIRLFKGGVFGT